MGHHAIIVESLWKNFRLYHERNRYIKAAFLRGRRARYDEFWALSDVSFTVDDGATVGFIGPNGSGKTTLLKCLTGIYQPDRGRVAIDGTVAALLELGAGFHTELTGAENIYLNGAILGMSKKDIDRQFNSIVEFAGLERFIDTPIKNFSSGMVVRLGFSIAAHVEPRILLIDEVLSVGDQEFQRRSSEKIEQFRREGRTIVVVSHSLGLVQQLCKQVAWLDKGRVREFGPAAEVIASYTGGTYTQHTEKDADLRQRWGTGDAKFSQIELLDQEGNKTTIVQTGDAIRIRLQLNAFTRLEAPVLGVYITSLNGEPLWSTSTRQGTSTIRALNGPATATLEIESVPLLEGTYFVSASLSDSTGATEYDHCRNWIRFDVHQQQLHETGVISIPSKWRLERQQH